MFPLRRSLVFARQAAKGRALAAAASTMRAAGGSFLDVRRLFFRAANNALLLSVKVPVASLPWLPEARK